MLTTLKLGYFVSSVNVIYDEEVGYYLFCLELDNEFDTKLFRIYCNYNVLKLNILDYLFKVITGVVYDEVNRELHVSFDNDEELLFDNIDIDSLVTLNNH